MWSAEVFTPRTNSNILKSIFFFSSFASWMSRCWFYLLFGTHTFIRKSETIIDDVKHLVPPASLGYRCCRSFVPSPIAFPSFLSAQSSKLFTDDVFASDVAFFLRSQLKLFEVCEKYHCDCNRTKEQENTKQYGNCERYYVFIKFREELSNM